MSLPPADAILVFESGAWRSYRISASERGEWRARGWAAAFDLYESATVSCPPPQVVELHDSYFPEPINMGAIVENYPPLKGSISISSHELFGATEACVNKYRSHGVRLDIAVLRVPDLTTGWYTVDGVLRASAAVEALDPILSDLIPVAYGRAGFPVHVAVVVSVAVDTDRSESHEYLDALWIGGRAIGDLEGYGSDRGWTTRGNYAVLPDVSEVIGLDANTSVPVGAVVWAGL